MFFGLIQALRRLASELVKHRIALNANTVALSSLAASNERLADAIEHLAEAPPVETTAEWKTGTTVPE